MQLDADFDDEFSALFGSANKLDLSALHIAIAFGKRNECNIHIDRTGVAMWDMQEGIALTPGTVHHFFNELVLKSYVAPVFGTWFADRANVHVLSPEMAYRRLGVSLDVVKRDNFKISFSASCGLSKCQDIKFSKVVKLDGQALKSINPTLSISGRHRWLDGGN